MTAPNQKFNASREFSSVREAITYCNKQKHPRQSWIEVVLVRIAMHDYGFAGDLVTEGEQIISSSEHPKKPGRADRRKTGKEK